MYNIYIYIYIYISQLLFLQIMSDFAYYGYSFAYLKIISLNMFFP